MNLKNKKAMTAKLLKVGTTRLWFDPNRLNDVKEAITRDDIKRLVSEGAIQVKQKKGVSRGRARKVLIQKRKGRRNGPGSKKGKKTSRLGRKDQWITKIRSQRELLHELADGKNVTHETFVQLKSKAKGGFFRSRRHIKLYLTEHNLWAGKK
jgi:large subunit ribosomal protein L19e